MKDEDSFEVRDGLAVITIASMQSFDAGISAVRSAIIRAIDDGRRDLLVDARNIQFSPPDIPARHEMVRIWGNAAQGRIRVAMLVRPEFVDPEKFGVVAAANFGLVTNVFDDETEARAWLGISAAPSSGPMS